MSESEAELRQAKAQQKSQLVSDFFYCLKILVLISLVLFLFTGLGLGPINGHHKPARQNPTMQTCRTIVLSMFSYANDHDGHYPTGNSSTEVFQQLIDAKYVSDASTFYVNLPGKVRPVGNRLKSENVAYDVTCPVESSSPEKLPVVFLTGFQVSYVPGASAIPRPLPVATWTEWWNDADRRQDYLAVAYLNNGARVLLPDATGKVPNFVPADVDLQGKVYRQLTP